MSVARDTRAIAGAAICIAFFGCKNKAATHDGEVIGSTPLPASSTVAATPTGVVNAGMADLTPTPDQFQTGPVTGNAAGTTNPGLIDGIPTDPSVPPMVALPKKLPRDPGGAPIKITPMKITFANGRSMDQTAELKADGSLFFDGKKMAKISGNKIVVPKPSNSLSMRSDGFITMASPKGSFLKRDAVGITLPNGFRVRIAKDNSGIVSDAPGGGAFDYGRANIALTDDKTKTTALLIASTEMSGMIEVPSSNPQGGMITSQQSDVTVTGDPSSGTFSVSGDIPLGGGN